MVKRIKHKYYTKLPPNTKLVARPSRYGNPYNLSDNTREEALLKYAIWLVNAVFGDEEFLTPLIGYDLACYCSLDDKCHADIIIDFMEDVLK